MFEAGVPRWAYALKETEGPLCNLLKIHVPGLQGAAVRTLSVQFAAQLLGLALVLLEVSPWLTKREKNRLSSWHTMSTGV